MKKKWIAWLLALTMLFSLVPTAFAAGEQPAQSGLVFWLDGQLNTGSGFERKAAILDRPRVRKQRQPHA